MKIYRAIKKNRITQLFGENKNPIYKEFGMLGHNAIDFSVPTGTSLYYDVDTKGVVYKTETDSSGGIGLDIISKDTDGQFYKHRYWHLEKHAVKVGDMVETGDLIAYTDNTGLSTGSHLHRGLKPVSKGADGVFHNKLQGNGYFGGIDMMPFFKNIYVLDYVANLKGQFLLMPYLLLMLY